MCLAIPGKIISIDNQIDDLFRMAKVSFDGIIKQVNLAMVPEAQIGDYVLVHVGSAISVVDEDEAKITMNILMNMDELDELDEGEKISE
jgi:hydrogenase expression/formation protein HypC